MDSHELIDAQFDRAVEIVQGLPKTGPIQTGYEEKLTMYSLYKQATVGNVQGARPPIWDMLSRAKWDAWAKHRDVESYEAKWLYVDALLKVLRKYSDRTVARDLVQELESYAGDPSNIMMSRSLSHSRDSDSSESDDVPVQRGLGRSTTSVPPPSSQQPQYSTAGMSASTQQLPRRSQAQVEESTSEEEGSSDDEREELLAPQDQQSRVNRPQSSLSSHHRYRTPMAGSLMMSGIQETHLPDTQPHPGFETPSAFAGPSSASLTSASPPHYAYGPQQYPNIQQTSQHMHTYSGSGPSSTPFGPRQHPFPSHLPQPRPASRPMLERAIENVQAHLAALSERIEVLESGGSHVWGTHPSSSNLARPAVSPTWPGGRRSPYDAPRDGSLVWDPEDMGLWTYLIRLLSRLQSVLRYMGSFLAHSDNRSPAVIVLRRLALDVSFVLFVMWVARIGWRRSGVRRREVLMALRGLGRALLGAGPVAAAAVGARRGGRERLMVDRGV